MQSETVQALLAALVSARSAFQPLKRSGKNAHLGNRYSTLEDVYDACAAALGQHGLVVVQQPIDGALETRLYHVSGEWIGSRLPLVTERPGPQALGSVLTYFRRYALKALLGLEGEFDDDAETATARPPVMALRPKVPTAVTETFPDAAVVELETLVRRVREAATAADVPVTYLLSVYAQETLEDCPPHDLLQALDRLGLVAEVRQKAARAEVALDKICHQYGVENLHEMTVVHLKRASARLDATLKKAKAHA